MAGHFASLFAYQAADEDSEEDSEYISETGVASTGVGRERRKLSAADLLPPKDGEDDPFERKYSTFDADAWGLTILTIVRDLTKISTCDFKGAHMPTVLARGIFGLILWAVNIWLQVGILFYVWKYVLEPSVIVTQANYAQYHRDVFDEEGAFDAEGFDKFGGPKSALCTLALSKQRFTFLILFVWTSKMITEARNAQRLMNDLYGVASLPEDAVPTDMLMKVGNYADFSEEWHLVALNCTARCMIFVLVIIPKFGIALLTLYIGCEWLCATEDFASLILNALALSFVIDIDEQIFDAFAPQVVKFWLEATKYCHIKHYDLSGAETTFLGAPKDVQDILIGYARSFVYVLVCFLWTYIYLVYLQQVIPGYKHDIEIHCMSEESDFICPRWSFRAECFPYGSPTSE